MSSLVDGGVAGLQGFSDHMSLSGVEDSNVATGRQTPAMSTLNMRCA